MSLQYSLLRLNVCLVLIYVHVFGIIIGIQGGEMGGEIRDDDLDLCVVFGLLTVLYSVYSVLWFVWGGFGLRRERVE